MIAKIVVTPRPGENPMFTIEGDFSGVMHAAGLLPDGSPETQKAPEAGASGALASVVAGAGFEPAGLQVTSLTSYRAPHPASERGKGWSGLGQAGERVSTAYWLPADPAFFPDFFFVEEEFPSPFAGLATTYSPVS